MISNKKILNYNELSVEEIITHNNQWSSKADNNIELLPKKNPSRFSLIEYQFRHQIGQKSTKQQQQT